MSRLRIGRAGSRRNGQVGPNFDVFGDSDAEILGDVDPEHGELYRKSRGDVHLSDAVGLELGLALDRPLDLRATAP